MIFHINFEYAILAYKVVNVFESRLALFVKSWEALNKRLPDFFI